jgi:hypothetical protein
MAAAVIPTGPRPCLPDRHPWKGGILRGCMIRIDQKRFIAVPEAGVLFCFPWPFIRLGEVSAAYMRPGILVMHTIDVDTLCTGRSAGDAGRRIEGTATAHEMAAHAR